MSDLVAGDNSKLIVTCTDGSNPIDLTGCTVRLRFRYVGNPLPATHRAMTITNPTAGIAELVFASGDLIVGQLVYEVAITTPVGDVLTQTATTTLNVRSPLL